MVELRRKGLDVATIERLRGQGFDPEQISKIMTTLTKRPDNPDAIRPVEAIELYGESHGLNYARLSNWGRFGWVAKIAKPSHKERYFSHNDIRRRLGLEPLMYDQPA